MKNALRLVALAIAGATLPIYAYLHGYLAGSIDATSRSDANENAEDTTDEIASDTQ